MRVAFGLLLSLYAGVAFAQQGPDRYTLTILPVDVITMGKALGSQPYNDVANLLGRLQAQIDAQNQAAVKAAAKPAEPAPESKPPQ